jgi:integrase/recombinase XerC
MGTKTPDPSPDHSYVGRPTVIAPSPFLSTELQIAVRDWTYALEQTGKAANTITAYERDVWHALNGLAWCLDHRVDLVDLCRIGQAEQDDLVARWRGETVITATILRRLAAFRNFARFLQQQGSDCRGILGAVLPSVDKTDPSTVCSQTVIDRLIELKEPGRGDDWIELRDFAFVLLQSETALTTGETVGLEMQDRPTGRRRKVTVRSGRLADRDLVVSDACLKAIDRYLEARHDAPHPDDPLFIGARGERLKPRLVQLALEKALDAIGAGRGLTMRSVRHGLAYRMKRDGARVDAIAHQLGISVQAAGRYFKD